MDEKRIIKKYIGRTSVVVMTIGLILLMGSIGCVFMALQANARNLPEPTCFDALEGELNSYSYLDVIGVSDWIYRYDKTIFYILEDAEHTLNIGSLSNRDFSMLEYQNEYWKGLTYEERPVRLTGVVLNLTDTMKETIMNSLGLTDEEFDGYFGYRQFRVGSTPNKQDTGMWTAFAIILCLFAFPTLACGVMRLSRDNSVLKRLDKTGQLHHAAAELESYRTERVGKDRMRLGERYVFGRNVGLAASWEDVLWCYVRSECIFTVSVGQRLIICTADGKIHSIDFGGKGLEEAMGLTETIQMRNPRTLIGFSAENYTEWRKRCREKV